MQKAVFVLVTIFGTAWGSVLQASPIANVVAVASPAWIQRGDEKNEPGRNSELHAGDYAITGENGLLEVQLNSGVELRVYSTSEIRIMAPARSESPGNPAVLSLQRGRICLESPPPSSTGNNFNLNVADVLRATIQQYGHICVTRRKGMSSINLRAGSVQITNAIEPGIVVLSEAGIEFRMDDEGSYQLIPSVQDAAIADMSTEPFIVEAIIKQGSSNPSSGETAPDIAVSEEMKTGEPATDTGIKPDSYSYTVYLFSTRSAVVADQVNERFHQAGHKTRILVNEKDSSIRYRIAVPGFESSQSARDFADSIVGKLGVKDTWIGRDRQDVAE